MKALTLWQPWSWAVAYAGKRIENRDWRPPADIIGQRIAIHAGKTLDQGALGKLRWALRESGLAIPSDEAFARGAIEAVAVVAGWIAKAPKSEEQARWFTGPCGWVLTNVVPLAAPVPCPGARKLWEIPAAVEAEVQRQLGAAHV